MRTPILVFKWLAVVLFVLTVSSVSAEDIRKLVKKIDLTNAETHFDSHGFQSRIITDQKLSDLAAAHSAVGEKAVLFGFSGKSAESKFFTIGALYSETLAFIRSGDTDQAVRRIDSIKTEFLTLNAGTSLLNFITKLSDFLKRNVFSSQAITEFFALLQPFLEDFCKNAGEDKLTLFRAGAWLVDMSLAASSGDTELLRQTTRLDYFRTELKKMDAPKGVLDSLDQIAEIAGKKEITDRDSADVLKLVKNIQSMLV